MKAWIPVSICSLLAVSVGLQTKQIREEVHPPAPVQGLDAHETHASVSLLGQFRTSISGWLWLRTDLYLHNGVAMRPLSDWERNKGVQGVGTSDNQDGALHNDEHMTTVTPSADRDFRGVLGDLDRARRAYKDMKGHSHNDPQQALPLFRLMTWIDPHFIPGWVVGSAVLSKQKDPSAPRRAIEYLDQGLDKNPESVEILNQRGSIYLLRLRDSYAAMASFEAAIRSGEVHFSQLSESAIEDLEWAYRWLALVYRDRGMINKMYGILDQGLDRFPEDAVMQRMRDVPPYVLRNRDYDQAKSEPVEPEDDHEHDHEHGDGHDHDHDH